MIEFSISSVFFPKQSTVEFSVVSSAYSIKANLSQAFTMSLINILKRSGPIMEPWGTTVKTAIQLISNKQAFKSEVKKLLRMELIQLDEEIYPVA